MATISSAGIGSGLDVNSIVSQLVALEKTPLKALTTKATTLNAQVTAMGDIKSQFSTLADIATKLSSATAWSARTASSSNTSAATITTTSTAAASSFTLDVDALAKKQAITSPAIATGTLVGAGTMTIRLGTWSAVTGSATTDNTGVSTADAALPAAQAALVTANANLVTATTNQTNATNALTPLDAALTTATSDNTAAQSALTTATSAYNTAVGVANSANSALASANSALTSANATLSTANSNVTATTTVFDTATTNAATAATTYTAALAAKSALDTGLSTALADNNTAAGGLSAYVLDTNNAASAGVKAFSDSFTQWVTAMAGNDHQTSALQGQEDAAFAAKSIAYNALSAGDKATVDGLLASYYTSPAAPQDVSTLKGQLVTANAGVSTAFTGKASADNALAMALSNKTAAADALTSATTAQSTATTNQATAQTAADTAAADVTTQATAKATAQTAADATAAALSTATTDRNTAASALATANTALANANAAVTSANTAVTNATAGISSSRPTFTPQTGSSDVAITVLATDTVASLVTKINAANAGVVATTFFDGTSDRLQLTSKDTGAAAGFRVQVTDTGDGVNTDNNGLSRLAYDPQTSAFGMASSGITAQYGQDAKVRINGMAVTSKTNTLTDNFPGVTINLLSTTTTGYGTPSEAKAPVTMSISEDVTAAVKNINDFVTAYNAVNKTLADDTKYDAATKTGSIFQADSTIIGLQSVLRSIQSSITTGGAYSRLMDAGIERQLDGSLTINTAKLSIAANNGTELQKLFTTNNSNTQTNGFALKFAALANGMIAAGGGVTNKSKALQDAITRNTAAQDKVNAHATAVEAQLKKTYSALDGKMASLNALSAYVQQQVTTWNKSTTTG